MKTIIISDLHLRTKVNSKKLELLKKLFSSADTIILNGDIFDGYYISYDEFINSKWKELLDILATKNTTYLYGNHDKKKWIPDKRPFFVKNITDTKQIITKDFELLIEHGHRLAHDLDDQFPFMINPITKLANTIKDNIMYYLMQNPILYKILTLRWLSFNIKMKKWATKNLVDNQVLVVGHSHLPVYTPEERFINTGMVTNYHVSYLEIVDGVMELIDRKY